MFAFFFFFNDPATTEIYTLSLHDALPIYAAPLQGEPVARAVLAQPPADREQPDCAGGHAGQPQLDRHAEALRSEEHTSELQSRLHLVCRLLLEKKKEQ